GPRPPPPPFPTRRSSDLLGLQAGDALGVLEGASVGAQTVARKRQRIESGDYGEPGFRLNLMHKDLRLAVEAARSARAGLPVAERSEEHTSELQSRFDLVC